MNSLALKAVALLKINRFDLAEGVLRQMKQIDEDNCLTYLVHSWLHVSSIYVVFNRVCRFISQELRPVSMN